MLTLLNYENDEIATYPKTCVFKTRCDKSTIYLI